MIRKLCGGQDVITPLRALLLLFVLALALPGCAKKVVADGGSSATVAGEASKEDAFLAYEHQIRISLGKDHLATRLDALRAACSEDRFGTCSLLTLEQGDGQASLTLRTAPAAIEPLVALASQDGAIASRSLRAEDVADAVADTGNSLAMLQAHRGHLLDLREKPNLSVADTIALSNELARVETELDAVNRTAAQQRRRIETNLLALEFRVPYAPESNWAELGDAFGELDDSAIEGVTEALAMLGYGLPFLLIAFPLALLWRALWRWATGRRGS